LKNVFLYFGSFNPIHRGHIAVAEYVVEQGLCDEVILVVSPQNPLKPSDELLPEMERFEMAEKACAESRFPERIKASCIEFLLPKPSYTIDTLRHLNEKYGDGMQFSLLTGEDLIGQLPQWKEWEEVVSTWPIYVYPREMQSEESATKDNLEPLTFNFTLLEDAPHYPCSSTEIRALMHRGQEHHRRNEFGEALNDFNRVLEMSPWWEQARQMVEMIREILAFRHTDIYNP
jgi:nicotinate-nucleotide adenylyltransferase